MVKIERVYYDDLTDEEKEDQPNNGSGKEYASYIKITNDGETLMILSDAVEPEDATFVRDFSDVFDALELVYEQGLKDSK